MESRVMEDDGQTPKDDDEDVHEEEEDEPGQRDGLLRRRSALESAEMQVLNLEYDLLDSLWEFTWDGSGREMMAEEQMLEAVVAD
eukprot:scaffold433859_cov34-Prasinocladus_malaysianus.AAC.1